MRRTDQISEVKEISLANFTDTKVVIDSQELNGTHLLSFTELLKILGRTIVAPPTVANNFGFLFSTGKAPSFSTGKIPRINK